MLYTNHTNAIRMLLEFVVTNINESHCLQRSVIYISYISKINKFKPACKAILLELLIVCNMHEMVCQYNYGL